MASINPTKTKHSKTSILKRPPEKNTGIVAGVMEDSAQCVLQPINNTRNSKKLPSAPKANILLFKLAEKTSYYEKTFTMKKHLLWKNIYYEKTSYYEKSFYY